jgi:hypothetical protein
MGQGAEKPNLEETQHSHLLFDISIAGRMLRKRAWYIHVYYDGCTDPTN